MRTEDEIKRAITLVEIVSERTNEQLSKITSSATIDALRWALGEDGRGFEKFVRNCLPILELVGLIQAIKSTILVLPPEEPTKEEVEEHKDRLADADAHSD